MSDDATVRRYIAPRQQAQFGNMGATSVAPSSRVLACRCRPLQWSITRPEVMPHFPIAAAPHL